MRHIVLFFVLLVISHHARAIDFDGLLNSDTLKSLRGAAAQSSSRTVATDSLSDADVAKGLKEALSQGAVTAVSMLGKQDGFLGNERVKIPLPAPLLKAEGLLRALGQGKAVDDLVITMNRAAEAAVPEAKTLLLDAVKKITLQDAKNILNGGDNAATQYFRKATEVQLHDKFLPVVAKATRKFELTEKYNQYAGQASQIGLLDEKQASVQEYVTTRALDGLFLMMADEEKAIRQNPTERTGYWIKKVFGSSGQ